MEVCHALADLGASINLMPLSIWKKLSLPELTPTRMTLELADRSITSPKGVTEDVFVKVGKFHFLTDFVVVDFKGDPRVPLILGRSFLRTGRVLIDVYGEEITLRVNDESITFNLIQTMRYSSTYDDTSVNRVDVIDVACEDFMQDVLDFQYNPKSSSPTLVYDDLISKSDSIIIAKNLKVDEREALINVLKSHKQAIAWKISDIKGIDLSPWVSPIHCVPKKGGMTVVANENNELIPTRLVTSWRVCIDYRKLNEATRKDHFRLPFMDQMLERKKLLSHALMELSRTDACLLACVMLQEGIVLGHKISKSGIEVDRVKVDVIAKLYHPTTVKGVRSFLGHAGFYCRFIQDFSKIARPTTHLLEKEIPFIFSKECIDAFNTLKKKLQSYEDCLEDLFSNQPSGNLTFLPHPELTSPKVNNDIFDSEGCNVLSEKLLDLDSTKDLHPPLHDNLLSGSTTYFSSSNPLLEEFADELPPKYDDNLQFDIESNLKEIEFLLYQDKDSSLKDSIDQRNLVNLADIFVDSMPEMFIDEHALDYSSPTIFDEYDDDFLEVESDAENVYDDPFDSKGEKFKESKLLIDELDLPCDFLSSGTLSQQVLKVTVALRKIQQLERDKPRWENDSRKLGAAPDSLREGCNVLSEKLLDLDSTKDLHPPLHDNLLSGSTTYFSSSNPLLEEFADELPPIYDDNLQFDIESDVKEIEFLLYQDKDSSLKDSINQRNLVNLADIFVDSMPEMFTD
nr:reverse transcriptase domain-containing protein [Tanacetum cinerariifolium]